MPAGRSTYPPCSDSPGLHPTPSLGRSLRMKGTTLGARSLAVSFCFRLLTRKHERTKARTGTQKIATETQRARRNHRVEICGETLPMDQQQSAFLGGYSVSSVSLWLGLSLSSLSCFRSF